MAVVPTPTNRQKLGDGTSARYQAADFSSGAEAVGASVQRLGGAIGQVAEAKDHLDAIYDEARAKDNDNRFVTQLRDIEYGDAGFYKTQNADTLNARRTTEDAINRAYSDAMS